MCGRFVSTASPDEIAQYFDAVADIDGLVPNFNVAPTDHIYGVVADSSGQRRVEAFRWGLIPGWSKDLRSGAKMINARAETVAVKPAFKSAFRTRRCILPMDGFYEWAPASPASPSASAPAKQPFFVARADGEPLAVAGIWAVWRNRALDPAVPDRDVWVHSASVITTAANDTMAQIHDRMPVILPRSDWSAWLDPGEPDAVHLLSPIADAALTMRPVSTEVNSVRNNGPHLIDPC